MWHFTHIAIAINNSYMKKNIFVLNTLKHLFQIGLKVGVHQRGCNGLSYTLDYAQEKGNFDEEVVQDGKHQLDYFN